MVWQRKDKEAIIKTRFALLPTRIGGYWIWLQCYYKTWDFVHYGGTHYGYAPHWFIEKEDAEAYVRAKDL